MDSALEDIYLLARLRNGEQEAFEAIFRKYYPLLCAYGNRFVRIESAEEIVQDIMLWLWINRETHQINSSLIRYLLKMVYRRALNRLEHEEVVLQADTCFYEKIQDVLDDSNLYLINELSQRIEEAIHSLPDSYRETFVMHRFQGMTHKEIADELGVSTQTVNYRIQQSLKQLTKELKDYLPLLLPLLMDVKGLQ